MLGTIVNVLAIAAGSLLGFLFRGGIPEKYNETVMQSISLAVILIGLKAAFRAEALLVVIISLAVGSIVGELIGIERRLDQMGAFLERRFSRGGGGIAQGFVTASLIFCVGSMAIVGSLESGLSGNHQTLFAKAALDGIASIIFTSSLGIGVAFSALPVLLYQGLITISAAFMKPFLVAEVIAQMSAVGGLLIVGIGLNMLELKKVKVGNMLPAIFMPLLYYCVRQLFGF